MVQTIQNVVLWLKNWFYDKTEVYAKTETYSKVEVDNGLAGKLNNNLTTANKNLVTNGSGDVILEDKPNISRIESEIDGLDARIDNLESIKAIQVVSSLPTASADTMGGLYIISENSKINVYYTEQNGTSYTWHKMDADILDELIVNWSDIQNKPTEFTPSTHKHGHITNNGTISASSTGNPNKIIGTDSYSQLWGFSQIGTNQSVESNALNNIGTTANASQSTINTAINTKIGSKQDKGDCVTSIELVPKSQDNTGAIKLYYGDEP